MYNFFLNDNQHTIKNQWDELSTEEFIFLNSLLKQFRMGLISLFDVRTVLVLKLMGVDVRRINLKKSGNLNENVYHLSRQMNFFYKIVYEDKKAFSAISAKYKKQLENTFPEDLPQDPEIRAAAKLKKQITVSAEFAKNLVPELKIGRTRYVGYQFNIIEGLATTTLTALQFSEAQKVVQQYAKTESHDLLNLLCSILYSPFEKGGRGDLSPSGGGAGGGLYSESQSIAHSIQFKKVDTATKEAILLNFCAITNFIVHQTKYSILFCGPESKKETKKSKKYSLGLADNMYMLSKKGYGDSIQMENSNLFKFLDLLIKELADNVHELEKAGKKKAEIAEIMNLTITQINELLA